MSVEQEKSVIRKKARHGREEFDAHAMSPSKALRLSLERGADALFDLPLAVCALEQRRVSQIAVKDEAGSDCLILLLDGPEGARGGVLLDGQLVQALVEVQTMGRVRPGEVAARPFTGTDAAIAAPLVDAMLAGCEEKLAEADTDQPPGRFRFGDRVADIRGLTLALEAPEYELFRVTVDLAEGARTGVLTLLLPADAITAWTRPVPARADAPKSPDFKALAMTAPVTLDAVLDRIDLPLSRIWQLKPGMTLPISGMAIGRTELVAPGGHVAATVRLGQMNGFRAVRLNGLGAAETGPADPAGGMAHEDGTGGAGPSGQASTQASPVPAARPARARPAERPAPETAPQAAPGDPQQPEVSTAEIAGVLSAQGAVPGAPTDDPALQEADLPAFADGG